jgi:hypothetical protein
MKFYKDHDGVDECCRKLLKTQLNIAKNYCSCLVFFVEEVGKGASDGGQGGCKVMV